MPFDIDVPETMRFAEDIGEMAGVVHLAARVDFGDRSSEALFRANETATREIARVAASRRIAIVYASSVSVSCGVAATDYGQSKAAGERAIQEVGASSCCLRFTGIFGASGPSHLGINRSIGDAIRGVPPTQAGSGRARRNYVYVRDAAKAVSVAVSSGLEGVHVVGGTTALSIREMLNTICDVLLPGSVPSEVEGPDGEDQVFEPSSALPSGTSFREAIDDIRLRRSM